MTHHEEVLDYGFVELLDLMPADGDLIVAVADAARVSYSSSTVRSPDHALVEYLISHGHVSPFQQVVLKFRAKVPNFVRDQWFRHSSWALNAESARYSTIMPEFYLPSVDQVRRQSRTNKQGRGEAFDEEYTQRFIEELAGASELAFQDYNGWIKAGVAKELARAILPHNQYTTFVATVNLRDLGFFLKARLDHHAQWEIRQYAEAIMRILGQVDVGMVAMMDNWIIRQVVVPERVREFLYTRVPQHQVLGLLAQAKEDGLTKNELEALGKLLGK